MAANTALFAAVVAVAWSGAFYNRALASFGTVTFWSRYEGHLTVPEVAESFDLVFAEDGLNASISVIRAEDYLALRTNGKVDASTRDITTQLLVGHLGAIFHPAPKRVLLIGFGSGMTASALSLYPEVERIDCVEIEPAVMHAEKYLQPLHRDVRRDPRLRIILDDARNFLLTTRERYDLIVSEPSNPWIAGIASLFTEEFYREARARLRPAGMFVQWIQAYSLYPEDLRMVLATFAGQFPQVTLWRGEYPDFLLLAQTETRLRPARRDYGGLARRGAALSFDRFRALWSNAALRADYRTLGLPRPDGLPAFHLLDDADLRKLARGALHNTDDHTRLEYRAPRALLAKQLEDKNLDIVWRQRSADLPQSLRIDDRRATLLAAAETLLNLGEPTPAGNFLAAQAYSPPTPAAELVRGRWELDRGELTKAKTSFETALRLDKTSLGAAWGLGEVARRQLDYSAAELLLKQVLVRDPSFVPALESMMLLDRARERWQHAATWQARRIGVDPKADPLEYSRLGELLLRMGDTQRAEEAFFTTLEREPYSYAAHRNLGELYRQQKLWPKARQHLEFVVRFEPHRDAGSYLSLAEVYLSTGDTTAARKIIRKGLRAFPNDTPLQRLAALP